MKYEVTYIKKIVETIEANSLNEACEAAKKKAMKQKLILYGVIPKPLN